MSYDLARLRRNGLIERRPYTNTYKLTADGLRVALFHTKVHNRLLRRRLLAADRAPHRHHFAKLGLHRQRPDKYRCLKLKIKIKVLTTKER